MVHTILTHPGGAHKDDLLAVCVLIAEHRAPVVRREPTAAELDDAGVAVVDVGGRHEPDKLNFDHHHFPREHAPTCALSLVLDYFGLYRDALKLCDWLEPAEWFDSRGPTKTAKWLEVPRRAIGQLHSPIDVTLLQRFAACSELSAGDPLYEVMGYIGADLLDYLRRSRERIDFVAQHVERWRVPGGDADIEVLFLPRTEPLADEPSNTLKGYVLIEGLEAEVAAIVYPDRRGEGYGIARYEDHPQLDFAAVDGEDDVTFVHKSGFMCKTSATAPERLRALIAAAWKTADKS